MEIEVRDKNISIANTPKHCAENVLGQVLQAHLCRNARHGVIIQADAGAGPLHLISREQFAKNSIQLRSYSRVDP
jgi:hypothetical protein